MSTYPWVLKNVTLLTANGTSDSDLSLAALQASARHIRFHSIKLLAARAPSRPIPSNIELVLIPNMDWEGYNAFSVKNLQSYVSTEYALTVQPDGFVLNHNRWQSGFLDYDYIGAPWPEKLREGLINNRVGNSGFCLRSRRFLDHASQLHRPAGLADDIFFCRRECTQMQGNGVRYAPPHVAASFAVENSVPENPGASIRHVFGFHGRRTKQTRRLCQWLRNWSNNLGTREIPMA